ncbi:hypothetical protein SGQ44_01535 [Flavobacterium sp. Fl-77]|uniref:Uncharacterized protein n=1 Tax=Flavobacterium flavipigmentatum TaxID=2893884 RepID=A0AAJ2SE09_9FLAO|nr:MULTISPECIES: hypothetical protein [unclassified Flavobacterium]MDX6180818.1 hypothetical protein [Flavobacterium sp. Fl-33]MDX6184418.1 hypothetical protein [Flavobacterium sp. Fl-77]UFH39527.1 hypothetical protein LNP22_04430 [Flavobacterium sp. F-70]
MKTKTSLVKTIICIVLLFLSSMQISYSLISHFVHGKPYSTLFVVVCCLFAATLASSKRQQCSKK